MKDQDNKYYKPSMDEFHVGFEYEQKLTNYPDKNNWSKCKVETTRTIPYKIWVNDGSIRVKYLDNQDIEDLNYTPNDEFKHRFHKKIESDTLINCAIEIQPFFSYRNDKRENKVRIYLVTLLNDKAAPFGRSELFNGNIKNKSELQKVLNMIDIWNIKE